jgi:diguanylate cyclase (GGDEF)-like protein
VTVLAHTRTIRLLLVEDDRRSASAIQGLLRNSDAPRFDIHHVTTVAEARAAADDDRPDVIILDLNLPDAAELEALAALDSRVSEIPVIVLTGSTDEALASDALRCGAQDYLLKGSVNYESLLRSIRYAIERHRSVRDLAHITQQLELANRDLERLTLIDPLTELLNRRGLQQAVSREVRHLHAGLQAAAVLVIDLDDFAVINKALGHAVGDVVLKEMARRLRATVRGIDYVGRVGGDEFMIVLPETDPAQVARIAERIRLRISTSVIQHSTGMVTLTASIASMMLTTDMPAVDQLLSRAHLLLARAKVSGKNRVTFQSVTFDDTDKRLLAQADMCTNLTHGNYVLTVKQPIFRLEDQSPVAYEFLSRYSNGVYEVPDNFFRMCSERNVLTIVDHVCLRKSVEAAMLLPPYARFHVNIFPTTLLGVPVEHLLEIFPAPLPVEQFCLEISEQQIIGDPSYLTDIVKTLRKAGLLIAIDDVGFGSSCLESLVMLEPDMIKIDKRCVMGISNDRARIDNLRRYVNVARTLGCQVIAEGIESGEDLALVRDLGVEFGQGYYWGQPA